MQNLNLNRIWTRVNFYTSFFTHRWNHFNILITSHNNMFNSGHFLIYYSIATVCILLYTADIKNVKEHIFFRNTFGTIFFRSGNHRTYVRWNKKKNIQRTSGRLFFILKVCVVGDKAATKGQPANATIERNRNNMYLYPLRVARARYDTILCGRIQCTIRTE